MNPIRQAKEEWHELLHPKETPEEKLDAFLRKDGPEGQVDQQVLELESLYQKKLDLLELKHIKLQQRFDDFRYSSELEIAELLRRLDSTDEACKEKLAEKDKELEKNDKMCKDYVDYVKSFFSKTLEQQDEESALQVANLKSQIVTLNESQTSASQKLKLIETNVKLKREVEALQGEIEKLKAQAVRSQNEAERLMKARIAEDTEKSKREATAAQAAMKAIKQKMFESQIECDVLKKERNVLQFQLQECKEREGPIDRERAMLEEQAHVLELDREKNRHTISALKHQFQLSSAKQKSLEKELTKTKLALSNEKRVVKDFKHSLQELMQFSTDSVDEIKEALIKMYETYVGSSSRTAIKEEKIEDLIDMEFPDPLQEFQRQRKSLERTVSTYSKSSQRQLNKLRLQKRESMSENAQLLKENQELRKTLLRTKRTCEMLQAKTRAEN